jgi:rRNA-processing protein FCF1
MTYTEKLKRKIDDFIATVDVMLDNSSIYYHDQNSNDSGVFFVFSSKYHWGKKDERNQIIAKKKYTEFYENFELLLEHANPKDLRKIKETNRAILNLIEQNRAPSSIESGKQTIRSITLVFKEYLDLFDNGLKITTVIPDTNSIIQFPEPNSYLQIVDSENFEFVILPTVLSELDKHKINHRNEEFRKKVTSVIKRLKGYRKQGDILEGVTVNKTITVRMIATEPDFDKTLGWIDSNNNDDRIVANALELQINNPTNRVILVTSDINLQNKAELANLTVFDADELE